jgi:hypothetical protein
MHKLKAMHNMHEIKAMHNMHELEATHDTHELEVTDTTDVVDTTVTDDAHELEETHGTHELEETHDMHKLKAMHNMHEIKAMHNMHELEATHDTHELEATHDAHELIDATNIVDTTITEVTGAIIDTIDVVDTVTTAVDTTFSVDVASVDNDPVVQLIQVRNAELITKAQASINEYGTDYTTGDTGKLMKFELWLDAIELSSFNATATEIRGYQFDINWNDLEVGALNFPTIAGTNIGFNAGNPDNAIITFNSELGSVAMASSTAIVDTDITNDEVFNGNIQTKQLIGTFYVNPNADLETMILSIDNMLIVTDTDNISPANYATVLEISSVDATIQTDATNCLDNVSLNYFKDGVDTGVYTLVKGGDIIFPDTNLVFDAVKLSDSAVYTSGIAADDAVDVLRDIVHLDSLIVGSAAWHAADVNNDGVIAADDAVAVLRHIVHLDTIDTFDLIDNTTGNRITNLDANAIDVGQWSIVANGNVDQSDGFMDAYMVADIV